MKPRSLFKNLTRASKEDAFTLTELLVVTFTVVLLALVFLPAQAASRPKSQSARCLDNLREIMRAVMLYTRDYHDFFPPNEDSSSGPLGHVWVYGHAGVRGAQEFAPDVFRDPRTCVLAAYIGTNSSVFKCPADLRRGIYQPVSPVPVDTNKIGKTIDAARSIAMNAAVGTRCVTFPSGHSGAPNRPVDGPWLNNQHTHLRNLPWRTYGKLSEAMVPGPAKLWVIVEEDAYSLNDGGLAFGMDSAEWIDWPGTRHAMSGVVAFADGSVELHKWVNQSTRVIGGNVARRPIITGDQADYLWVRERTSVRAQ